MNQSIAIHLGFAGARALIPAGFDAEQSRATYQILADLLGAEISAIRSSLGLPDESDYFFVGLAQVAVGADWVFADACAARGIPLRVFLPQTRDEYLSAQGSNGPDFDQSKSERSAAMVRLNHPNVVEERVVSVSANRSVRFAETNVEIAGLADVIITLQAVDAGNGKIGGTNELAELGLKQGKPVLALTAHYGDEGEISLSRHWQNHQSFRTPKLPLALSAVSLPKASFVETLKSYCSAQAEKRRKQFEFRSRVVVWAHVGATALAAAALAIAFAKASGSVWMGALYISVPVLLVIELLLLGWGLLTHRALHHHSTTHSWAEVRLIAEIARSTLAFAGQYSDLKHLQRLPLPRGFRHLMQTLTALHLQSTSAKRATPWTEQRDHYLQTRLREPKRGQIAFYRREAAKAERAVHRAHRGFLSFTLLAIAATAYKIAATLLAITLSDSAAALSWLAIVLPVLAVAVMSISVNLDQEARASNFKEMREFLSTQTDALENAASEAEFLRLQSETEVRLLSEVLHWFHRRRFMNPA